MKTIFLHGLGQTPDSWKETLAGSKTCEYGVCLDLAAMIKNTDPTYQNLYNAFVKECERIDDKIDLCGLSLGSVLALNYAAEHKERVNSLALIAPQYKMPKWLLRFQNIIFRLMPKSMFVQTGFGKDEFIKLCGSMMELDISDLTVNIGCPALIICGERDKANKKASCELAHIMKNAELRIIKNCGHEVNTEAAEELANVLECFFSRCTEV